MTYRIDYKHLADHWKLDEWPDEIVAYHQLTPNVKRSYLPRLTCHAESDLSEWVCSECQCWIPLGLTPENISHASEWRYCPHCGAKVVR